MSKEQNVVRAAGTIPWRLAGDDVEVAIIHRPRYDDWSWPKGKAEKGESTPACAVRETLEETGLLVELGHPLPTARYFVQRKGEPTPKTVEYWAAQVVSEHEPEGDEVDTVRWVGVQEAASLLTYQRDVEQLEAFAQAWDDDALDTWPLVVVRHATAVPRTQWEKQDWIRPLDPDGRQRAKDLIPLLGAFGVHRILSSSAKRCVDTVTPFAEEVNIAVKGKRGLSEEGHYDRPEKAAKHVKKSLDRATPVAICSHGPVLPAMVVKIARAAQGDVAERLEEVASASLRKGEALVCHVSGRGDDARVVAVERHE